MDLDKLISDLQRDEGWRPYLYDDTNGQRVIPGYTLIGHPTIAWGIALDVSPFTMAEAMPILEGRAQQKWDELKAALPWVETQPEVIQRCLCNMAFNLGTAGLLKFNIFLGLIKEGQYNEAADDLAATAWSRQVPQRAMRIQVLIKGASV